ncbi:hypothetical protein BDQ94DRAFT_163521 [Aspergillus welwitschiae]|uniref:ubiquitinyl hydrolase 1 n=1 Tax=Aspergillus welwitschiae TaxID=1341132 RepID=A0A3F3PKS7_9EURO|nr:hypothetical protein BDQ94DRAFT_163521 [Aspergillus welwitschiae]RDH27534.1 hypothetical protein BDQ94DRAFT_163521 [Aspergillus welwitschiae]
MMDSYNITGVTLANTPPVTTNQWLQLGDDDPMFLGAKALQERYGLETNCYKNHVRLAAGYCHMPVILLQNPYKNHGEDFQDIFTPGSSLTWIRNLPEDIGVDIEYDIPVYDICPMISDDWAQMKARTGQLSELRQAIRDAYELTAQYLEALQPSTAVVLQCATNHCSVKKHAVLSSVEHPVAQVFCSSMEEAMQKRTRIVRFMQREHNETESSDKEEPLERELYRLVSSTLENFATNCPPESTGPWNSTINMLNLGMSIGKGGTRCKDTLGDALSNILIHGALAYYDQTGDKLIFDAFEASPRAADVLSAKGGLLRQFPGLSVAVPACVVDEPKFCSWLAGEISRLSSETVDKMVPTTRKAGAQALEERDAIHPGMVTENHMIQLLARGTYNNWPSFDKHMRDEVNWRNSRLPWRRSPLWLVIRVTLQTVLQRAFGDIEGHRQYKNFMLYLVAQIALDTNVMLSALCADQLQQLDYKVDNFTRLADIQMSIGDSDSISIPERFVCTPQDLHLTLSQSTTILAAAMSSGPTITRDQQRDFISVLDFERWVEYDMRDSICAIADRFGQYDKCATELFAGNPEAMSVMRLTQLELWVTFDRMCTAIPMRRAKDIENYIRVRHRDQRCGSIYRDPGSESFAVSYYELSYAQGQLREKEMEWNLKSSKYRELYAQAAQLEHDMELNSRGRYSCVRSYITIESYEWPLSNDESSLRSVLFELICPHWFAAWRDLTWKIKAQDMEQNLLNYIRTHRFAVKWGQRLTLGSKTKSWRRTHYNCRTFPVDFQEINRPDSSGNGWVTDQTESPTIKPSCTLRLPQGRYSNLQYALDSFQHTQNQLASPALSLNEESVGILIRQAAWELGTPSKSTELREAHRVFEDVSFSECLLETLEHRLDSIEANWNEHHTLQTLITLALRTLSLSEVGVVVERAAAFLRSLITTLDSQTGVQGICQLMYAVESHLIPILLRSAEDLFHPIRASVIVFETTVAWVQTSRILHSVEARTRQLIQRDASGLNHAIQECVPNTVITTPWSFGHGSLNRWAMNQLASDGVRQKQQVRYDLLSGELLVDNSPPGRLPESYTQHPTFRCLFGLRTLAVIPSNLPGSRFMSARPFQGYQVQFEMEEDRLVITAQQGSQAWQYDPGNWRLSMSLTGAGPAVMMRPRCTMVDIHSQLFVQLSKALTAENMVVVELARLRLRFFVNREGMLEAPELQATVDRRQDIGCFYDRRSVLIPYGDAQLSKKKHHTVIRIEPPEDSRNRYFQYFLDRELQELRGSSDMLGTLYQAYMHALTGFVLEDPAIHRSGTAEALRILRQARLRSSLPLERDCIELLGRLAAMTPRRKYYSSHLRCMQTLEWNSDLVELAQHDDFQALVQEIVDHAQLFSMLHDVSTEDLEAYVRCYQNRGEPHLIARARLRHAQFYPAEFGGSTVRRAPKPSVYSARDHGSGSERSNRVYEIASLVRDWPTGVPHGSDFYATISNWECIRLANLPVDSLNCNELLQLSFRDTWGALYELCRSLNRRQDSYSLMSLFCTIAFGGDEQLFNLRPLLAVAFSGRFADVAVPGFGGQSVLYLQRGEELIPSEIADQVSLHYTPFRDPPHLSGLSGARKREIREERERYLVEKKNHVRQCRDVVTDQWPCERPQLPDIPRLDRKNASEACALLCSQWYQNRTFLRFLREVQARLEALGTEPDEQNRSVPPAPSQQARPAERSFFPPSLLDLLRTHDIPTEVPPLPVPLTFNRPRVPRCYNNDTTPELDSLISEGGLRDSLEALEAREWPCSPTSLSVPRDVLERHCRVLTQQRDDLWDRFHETLTIASGSAERISSALLWPHISVLSIPIAPQRDVSTPIKRLLACYDRSDTDGFFKEAETAGKWLLLEIENNITIRVQQAEPGNAVSQLNMGEGKTTVITPMIALNLANGSTVPRIVVLKPLLQQSLILLTQVLGRILNRPIYHKMLKSLRKMYEQCQKYWGVLIALPEHILSFRLKAIKLETWLQDHCRNLIDESDEVLDPKFQLVYAIGNQQSLDGHMEQQVTELHNQDPSSISIEYRGARYPIIRFLRTDRADTLMSMVLSAIDKHGLTGLPLHLWSRRIRQRALNFIRFAHLMPQEPQFLRDAFGQGTTLRKLLVRLAGKRWLVDYGLHPSRCMMAVPFRAKGIPSEHAEFGHPDVAIILTCLSYYYHGLSSEQVRLCFILLAKENDPEAEYQDWICRGRSTLTPQLQMLTGVNLEDTWTFMEVLYPHLQYQKGLVDFYLSRVVFPKEVKEFSHILCTSAWDLPSKPNQPLTTGFSGTNDNRFLLPRSAPQRDLPQLLHTNALVLSLLLREENRRCIMAEDTMGLQLQAEQLLDLISQQHPPIRVIIDVAAIFFDERDEVTVIDCEGHCERLVSSAFKQRMGSCFIFLDQQHSRGVDLKLPADYRAAVLLGPRLPEDKLVQACNRMRGLGQGQSVTFVTPPEVSHSMPPRGTSTTSLDVIRWALTQTCNIFQSLRPLWALQGLQYHRRQKVWDKLLRGESPPGEAVQHIQEREARTLSQLYAPWDKLESWSIDETMVQDNPMAQGLLEVWRGSGHGMQQLAPLHEEQERQINHEVQREHQICRPLQLSAIPHHIHDDVRYFVTNGKSPDSGYTAVQSAFEIFRHTSAGQFGFPTSLAPHLYVTQDYSRTVQLREDCSDEFLKPVHWVLANTHDPRLLLLSQYEVNELLPDIRSSQKAKLLIYTPKTTKTMRSFEPLDFLHVGLGHTIPCQPQTTARDMGLFAGTLY